MQHDTGAVISRAFDAASHGEGVEMRSPGIAWLLSVAVVLCWTTVAAAAVCTVPSAPHPTIQEAVDDVGCTEIVIAAGAYVESVSIDRSLSVTGASTATTTVEGRFEVTGAATEITLTNLTIDAGASSVAGCFPEALDVAGGAKLTSNALEVINGDGDACLIFGDGFESGDTGAWSGTTP